MTFIQRFIDIRSFAYHITQRANLRNLARTRRLHPAADLIKRSGELYHLRSRRAHPLPINVDGQVVVLQDQRPLLFANAQLDAGWAEGDFVEFLNEHVFFWPGIESGPIKHGQRLLSHYEQEGPAVLRARTESLLAENPRLTPLFCAFNSGAPRMQSGRRVQRGPDLFLPAERFPRPPSGAVELAFRGVIALPSDSEFVDPTGRWAPIDAAV